jgi:uncharacterized protein
VADLLLDTGPLVAYMVRRDRHHAKVRRFMARFIASFDGALITTWPVLAEVCHLLPRDAVLRFMAWIAGGGAEVREVPAAAIGDLAVMMAKYGDLPMDLADASLLWLADSAGVRDILTLDARDFAIYRLSGGHRLRDVLGVG